MELDILGGISRLYGDCSQTPGGPIFVGGIEATAIQLAAATVNAQEEAAVYAANSYARDRVIAYNALNQFELIGDDAINGTTTHKDAILAIKAKFPK